jgi:hypothetical protein
MVVDAQISNNQSFAGLLTLSSTQVVCFEHVPAGFFVKLRTTRVEPLHFYTPFKPKGLER